MKILCLFDIVYQASINLIFLQTWKEAEYKIRQHFPNMTVSMIHIVMSNHLEMYQLIKDLV